MTMAELLRIWSRNINAEYIVPTLQKLECNNFIIHKDEVQEQIKNKQKYKKGYSLNNKKYTIIIKEVK